MAYDIGRITRELQGRFRLFVPPGTTTKDVEDLTEEEKNLATPENLKTLLNSLSTLTKELRAKRATMSDWLPDIGILQWDLAMVGWTARLKRYHEAVDKAPPGDRQDVLWSVTAPLLLGFFGGEDSDSPRKPIDAVTPFMLANQLEVDDAWRDERWNLLVGDLERGIKNTAKVVGAGLGIGLGIAAAVVAVAWLRK